MGENSDALARLQRLRDQGLLTDAEYEQQKQTLAEEPVNQQRPTWGEAWEEGREFGRGLRRGMLPWIVATVVMVLAIWGYFLIKAHDLARERGELNPTVHSAAVQSPTPAVNGAAEEQPATDAGDGHITAAQVSGPFTAEQKEAIATWTNLEGDCRGSTDETVTESACKLRDAALNRMIALGVCWGREDQSEAEYEVHICAPGSIGFDQSPQANNAL